MVLGLLLMIIAIVIVIILDSKHDFILKSKGKFILTLSVVIVVFVIGLVLQPIILTELESYIIFEIINETEVSEGLIRMDTGNYYEEDDIYYYVLIDKDKGVKKLLKSRISVKESSKPELIIKTVETLVTVDDANIYGKLAKFLATTGVVKCTASELMLPDYKVENK